MAALNNRLVLECKETREEDFRSGSPEKFQLSLEFGDSFVLYALFDPVSGFIRKTGRMQFDFSDKKDSYAVFFSELQSLTDIFRPGYHSVFLTWNRSGATLVPKAFYTEAKKEELLGFNFGKQENDLVIAEDINGLDVKVIYALPAPLKLFFDSQLSNHRLKHIATSLTEILLSGTSSRTEKKALVHINPGNFNLLIVEKGLKFFNTFEFQSAEDILYYLLFAFEQSNFDPQTDKLLLAGEAEAGSGIHQLLSQYIRNLSFAQTDKKLVRGTELSKIPHHFFFNTLNRFVCG